MPDIDVVIPQDRSGQLAEIYLLADSLHGLQWSEVVLAHEIRAEKSEGRRVLLGLLRKELHTSLKTRLVRLRALLNAVDLEKPVIMPEP